jgi:putative SOS response-associated peptidase YedK
MCGRYSFVVKKEKVKKQLLLVNVDNGLLENSYNIAPTQNAYLLAQPLPTTLQTMQWGLIPHWSKDGKGGASLINARVETIVEKPSFRESIQWRRCVVLADSFYEWRTERGRKFPYRIQLPNDELLLMAGIWDEWNRVKTFSIITTEPNAEMSKIHNRMPVILRGYVDCEKWLGKTDLVDILDMCKKPEEDFLHIYRVSEKINSVKNNSADMHNEVPEELRLF